MFDRFISQVGGKIITRVVYKWKYLGMVAEKIGCPLVGFSAHEPVKVLKTLPRRPLIKRTCHTVLKIWCIVILAEPGCRISIVFQDHSNTFVIQTDDGIIPGVTGGQFSDNTAAHRMVIATGDQRSPGWRT